MAKTNFCTDAIESLKRDQRKLDIELRSVSDPEKRRSLMAKRADLAKVIKGLEYLARGAWSPEARIETAMSIEERVTWDTEQEYNNSLE